MFPSRHRRQFAVSVWLFISALMAFGNYRPSMAQPPEPSRSAAEKLQARRIQQQRQLQEQFRQRVGRAPMAKENPRRRSALQPNLPSPDSSVVATSPANAMRAMFEQLGQQSSQVMPGMFSQLSAEQLAELESVSVDPRDESDFGNQVLQDYEARLKTVQHAIARSGAEVDYLRALVQRVMPHMQHASRYPNIDVAIVQTDDIDAYSIPGGHLLFTSGLIEDVKSEAELIGVVAHELSHLDRGHQLLPLKQAKQGRYGGNVQSTMMWVSTMAKPFRSEFESQADADAVRWLIATGYDPRQLAQLLKRWSARQDHNGRQDWTQMIPDFARSHPDSGRRAAVILDQVRLSGVNTDPLVVGCESLDTRIPSGHRP